MFYSPDPLATGWRPITQEAHSLPPIYQLVSSNTALTWAVGGLASRSKFAKCRIVHMHVAAAADQILEASAIDSAAARSKVQFWLELIWVSALRRWA